MNILVFSWRDTKHPLAGGAEQVMHEHMRGWIAAGHQVTLFSSKLKNASVEEVIDGVHIVRQGNQYLGVQVAGFFYYLKNRNHYDFVVDQFHGLPFFTPIYVKKPKLAVIQETAREVWFLNPLPQPLNWIVGLIGYLGEPLLFLPYKKIAFMTGSQSAKKDVAGFGIPTKNINVVPHGVITCKVPSSIKKEKKFTIVFLGILSKDKGVEDALKCFAILKNKGDYHFWVIGRPETKEYELKIKKLIGNLNLEKEIKFWGFVSQEKKFELLKRAHILINPSVKEGWGLVNIEANSMGTPVIAYSSPGLIDSIKNNKSGIICSKNTPEELSTAIFNLLSNSARFERLQKSAKEWSENFNWDKSRKQSLKIIENI